VIVFASIRPDHVNVPLLLHVVGAMLLVGGLLAGASALAFARGQARLARIGYRSLLVVALPGWVCMRVGAEWTYSEEGWGDLPATIGEPDWLGLGAVIADVGGLLLGVALVVGGVGVVRLRAGRGATLLRVTLALSGLLLAAFLVAAWAMSAKPA
jgi:hypothetical protein